MLPALFQNDFKINNIPYFKRQKFAALKGIVFICLTTNWNDARNMKQNLRAIYCKILSLFACIACCSCALAQTVKGTAKDFQNGVPLVGVSVVIKGTTVGAITDFDGNFEFSTSQKPPFTLVASYIGFVSQEIQVNELDKPIVIRLGESEMQLKSFEVSDIRISEKQKESPLTVESMDIIAIKQTSAANFYEGLGQLKGVDLTSASIGFKVINTRGFNSTSPVRSLQIIDGVDNQSPGLNFSLGNFLGASELDVQKVDLIVGASSAFYGPNAFNGVISMNSRSPFVNPGLEVSAKTGERNLFECAIRWAQVIKNKRDEEKFGYKFNAFYMRANDWEANNLDPTPQSKSGKENPGGYDAVNIYGDEYITGSDFSSSAHSYPGLGVFYRKGYSEKDLVDYNTRNLKLCAAFHYKIKRDLELIYVSSFGNGTTVYQGDNRYSLKDILFFQNRLELKKENKYFIRAYATNEDAGKSYDAYFTALLLQRAAKSDNDWLRDYYNDYSKYATKIRSLPGFPKAPPPNFNDPGPFLAYQSTINPFLLENYYDTLLYFHGLSSKYAAGQGYSVSNLPYFEPGTARFDSAFQSITTKKSYSEGGSRFYDKSALYHIQGEYKFDSLFVDITIGGNYRLYKPKSQGTIFSDTGGVRIKNYEYGFYLGIEKRVLQEKVKINVTTRYDKSQNFDGLISPAVSGVWNITKNNIFRVSFSSAIRNPTLTDQYLYYPVGRAILIGNLNGFNDLVTIPSLIETFDKDKNFSYLSYFNVAPVKPEKVKTIEFGYRTTIGNHLYFDGGYYYSKYKDFIGYKIGVDIDTSHLVTPFGSIANIDVNNVYRVATNSLDVVTTQGVSVGLNYYFLNYYSINGNYSWNKLNRHNSEDPLIPAFNTPEHKFNIGLSARDINSKIVLLNKIWEKLPIIPVRNWSFNVNYRWVDGFIFEGSPQFTGNIKTYNSLDAQISKKVPVIKSTFKLGASNLLNNKHYEVYGGPLVGRLAYFSILVELN